MDSSETAKRERNKFFLGEGNSVYKKIKYK